MPIHGKWCNSKTIATTCKFCGERVFYFSCDCGSKVFFDVLGGVWPKHQCSGYNSEDDIKIDEEYIASLLEILKIYTKNLEQLENNTKLMEKLWEKMKSMPDIPDA